jgi:hypothetical protein
MCEASSNDGCVDAGKRADVSDQGIFLHRSSTQTPPAFDKRQAFWPPHSSWARVGDVAVIHATDGLPLPQPPIFSCLAFDGQGLPGNSREKNGRITRSWGIVGQWGVPDGRDRCPEDHLPEMLGPFGRSRQLLSQLRHAHFESLWRSGWGAACPISHCHPGRSGSQSCCEPAQTVRQPRRRANSVVSSAGTSCPSHTLAEPGVLAAVEGHFDRGRDRRHGHPHPPAVVCHRQGARAAQSIDVVGRLLTPAAVASGAVSGSGGPRQRGTETSAPPVDLDPASASPHNARPCISLRAT